MIGIFKDFKQGLEYLFGKIGFDEAEKSYIIGFFAKNPELAKVEKLEEIFHFLTDKSLKNVSVFLSNFFEISLDKVFWAIVKASEAESIITSTLAMETYGEVQGLVEEKRYSEALEKFKILYTKKRLEGQKDSFYISYGTCQEGRKQAELEAIKLGIIKANQACYIENNISNEVLQIALGGIKNVGKSIGDK
jgi:hypothetical protein